jgi:hypothetical protein
MNVDYRKRVVQEAVETAVIADTIGFGLNGYGIADRPALLKASMSRSLFPVNKKNASLTGVPSHNALVLVNALDALCRATTPEMFKFKVQEVSSDFKNLDLSFGIAGAVGCVAGVRGVSKDEIYALLTQLKDIMRLREDAFEAMLAISVLLEILIREGFICASHVHELVTVFRGRKGQLAASLNYIVQHRFDKEFICGQKPDPSMLQNLTYHEVLVIKIVFWMMGISTAWGKKPRGVMDMIVRNETGQLHDILFLYGLVCGCSEHGYALFHKDFHDTLEEAGKLRIALRRLRERTTDD